MVAHEQPLFIKYNMAAKTTRIKQYADSSKGPFIVYIRRKEYDLDQITIQKFVFEHYKSCSLAFSINEYKMKFELTDLNEANQLVKDQRLVAYKVYVPAREVEVRGVVSLSVEMDANILLKTAYGGFKNPNLAHINILEVYRFNSVGTKTPTNKVKVTFEGTIVPDHIIVDRCLHIRVQQFRPKAFFCEKCLGFNHSTSYCTSSKQKCKKCGGFHNVELCTP